MDSERKVSNGCSGEQAEQIERLVSRLNLGFPGLDRVKAAVEQGDSDAVCRELADYYKTKDCWLSTASIETQPWEKADPDAICDNIFTLQSVTGQQSADAEGKLDWQDKGPNHDDEWAWLLNRHAFVVDLLNAWRKSGSSLYAIHFNRLMQDWVSQNPPPRERTRDAAWRPLEVGLRMSMAWPFAFYGFREAPEFQVPTRIQMLDSFWEHAHYLSRFHGRRHNHASMELDGLLLVALAFPEFKQAEIWLRQAMGLLRKELDIQRYPDGSQFELTSHYHWVSTFHIQKAVDQMVAAGKPVDDSFFRDLESMWNYLAYTLRPNGMPPLNNDSDLMDHRQDLLKYAKVYNRADWAAIVNHDTKGPLSVDKPSVLFPWAGHFIMRSGWDRDAQWAFFDCGPWGASHQHNDHLHLSIHAAGRDLLVDSGRFAYHGEVAHAARGYALGSSGHNVLLIDGNGQRPGPKLAEDPLGETQWCITNEFDYVRSSYDAFENIEGRVLHRRSIIYVRNRYWIVVDEVETEIPRTVEALWHFHPDCSVEREGFALASKDAGKGNLALIPCDFTGELELVRGRKSPYQGWYSPVYNEVFPTCCAIYRCPCPDRLVLIWGITTAHGDAIPLPAEKSDEDLNAYRICVGDPWNHEVTIPRNGQARPSLVARS